MASWSRVAAGLQLVAEQAAKQAGSQVTTLGIRSAQHGLDVASSLRAAAQVVLGQVSQVASSVSHSPMEKFHESPVMMQSPIKPEREESVRTPPKEPTRTPSTPSSSPNLTTQQSTRTVEPSTTAPLYSTSTVDNSVESRSSLLDDQTSGVRTEITSLASKDSSEDSGNPRTFFPEELRQEQHPSAPPITLLQEGRPVPSTRIGRAAGFAQLGLGLALGTAVEGVTRLLGGSSSSHPVAGNPDSSSSSSSIIVNDANSDRLASSLCRMRGAALKMGQMLSIQDESLLPPGLQRALKQVRQGAEAMPRYQLEKQMETQLGKHWRSRFESFDNLPFAAASIGQVHRAAIRTSAGQVQDVVVKVQYPGVARSIESDLRNLSMLVTWTGMAPPGLFLENVIRVGQQELSVECDYRRELHNQRRIQQLVEADPLLQENRFVVPGVIPELSTDEILTSEYRPGGTIDKVSHLSQEERNRIGRTIMYLTMKELFVWRFMQTDPNWGNFLYDVGSGTTSLIDFGATREYSKAFVDGYLRIVWASANRDEAELMEQSYRMNFLTGEENEQMQRAHKLSGYTVGEPFHSSEPFDFRGSNISTRMGEHTSVFLRHRLTPPPEEVYTLHRKLAGAYMLCIKLGAVIACRDMLLDIVTNHRFEDGLKPLTL